MKKILIILCAVFICGAAIAQTIRWHIGDTVYQTTTCNAGESITPPTAPDKFGYSFSEWAPYKARIEYLESTGTQWIDTGIIPSYSKTKVEMDIFTTLSSGTASFMFGCGYGPQGNRFFIQTESSSFSVGIATTYQITSVSKGRANIIFSPNGLNSYKVTINNAVYTYATNFAGTPVDTMKAFKTSGTRIHYLKIYDNNILVRDFIPVLDSNGTPCMYDRVESKFYYNQGTGNFIAGPVLQ